MATLLLLICLAAIGGAVGILYMLFGPTGPLFAQSSQRPSYAAIRFQFAETVSALITPEDPGTFVTTVDTIADFLEEDAVVELPSAATIVSLPRVAQTPAAIARIAEGTPSPARPIPSVVPRLGVSAPQRGRHLAPPAPRGAIPPLPRTRSAHGSDAPKLRPSAFASGEVTIKHPAPNESSDTDYTLVD